MMSEPSFIPPSLFLIFLICHLMSAFGGKLPQNASPKVTYRVNLDRIVGRTQSYVLVCREETREGGVATGRAEIPAPKNAALERGFLRCALRERPNLVDDCAKGRKRFEKAANRLFKSCASAPPLPKDGNPDVRNFDRDRCEAFFVRFLGPGVAAGLLVCECLQLQFTVPEGKFWVVLGRAFFNAEFAPGDAVKEVEELEKCANASQEQLMEVCLTSPEDYELLALHILQVCCKRLRKAGDAKFQCAATVPADVAFLKYMSVFGE